MTPPPRQAGTPPLGRGGKKRINQAFVFYPIVLLEKGGRAFRVSPECGGGHELSANRS